MNLKNGEVGEKEEVLEDGGAGLANEELIKALHVYMGELEVVWYSLNEPFVLARLVREAPSDLDGAYKIREYQKRLQGIVSTNSFFFVSPEKQQGCLVERIKSIRELLIVLEMKGPRPPDSIVKYL